MPFRTWEFETAPVVLGQELAADMDLGTYVPHVWLWRNNPSGIFADWNPMVTCDYAIEEPPPGAGEHTGH